MQLTDKKLAEMVWRFLNLTKATKVDLLTIREEFKDEKLALITISDISEMDKDTGRYIKLIKSATQIFTGELESIVVLLIKKDELLQKLEL